eukprot:CAMPEP_0170333292 /NCGR_PEP_ID=MMETSP0116_2-20130129/67666_1 /TAXON_ID=400756 /ORGANISM="Durinskia baltica, Strain CSIRO CS-38" /LENGTH=114 /DNA_ID=CAMNT_0010586635 /DNA_START=270 /DNA_END=614 /DNA_ORIENTATION=-
MKAFPATFFDLGAGMRPPSRSTLLNGKSATTSKESSVPTVATGIIVYPWRNASRPGETFISSPDQRILRVRSLLPCLAFSSRVHKQVFAPPHEQVAIRLRSVHRAEQQGYELIE